ARVVAADDAELLTPGQHGLADILVTQRSACARRGKDLENDRLLGRGGLGLRPPADDSPRRFLVGGRGQVPGIAVDDAGLKTTDICRAGDHTPPQQRVLADLAVLQRGVQADPYLVEVDLAFDAGDLHRAVGVLALAQGAVEFVCHGAGGVVVQRPALFDSPPRPDLVARHARQPDVAFVPEAFRDRLAAVTDQSALDGRGHEAALVDRHELAGDGGGQGDSPLARGNLRGLQCVGHLAQPGGQFLTLLNRRDVVRSYPVATSACLLDVAGSKPDLTVNPICVVAQFLNGLLGADLSHRQAVGDQIQAVGVRELFLDRGKRQRHRVAGWVQIPANVRVY